MTLKSAADTQPPSDKYDVAVSKRAWARCRSLYREIRWNRDASKVEAMLGAGSLVPMAVTRLPIGPARPGSGTYPPMAISLDHWGKSHADVWSES
jgi:hypothetical protein